MEGEKLATEKEEEQKVEEKSMNTKAKNEKLFYILIIVASIVISFILGYFTNEITGNNDKETNIKENQDEVTQDNEDESEKENNDETTKDKEEIIQIKTIKSKLLFDNIYEDEGKTKEIEYDGVTYKVNIKNQEYTTEILLDNKKIFEYGRDIYSIKEIYSLGDLIVVLIRSSGTRGQSIEIVDFEGNSIKIIGEIEYNNLLFDIGINDINLVDNKIVLKMTAVGEGLTLVFKEEVAYEDAETLPYSEAFKTKYNVSDETIVEAEFTFEYLGNKKFATLKMTDQTTYKEFIDENY